MIAGLAGSHYVLTAGRRIALRLGRAKLYNETISDTISCDPAEEETAGIYLE